MPLVETVGSGSARAFGLNSSSFRLPIRDSLQLYLDPNNPLSYPGSGTTVYDLSGNNYTHALTQVTRQSVGGVQCFDMRKVGTQPGDNRDFAPSPSAPFTYGNNHTLIAWAWMNPKASQQSDWRTLWRSQPDDHPLLVKYDDNDIGYYDNTNDRTSVSQTGSPGLNYVSYGVSASSYEGTWRMYSIVGTGGYYGTSSLHIDNSLVGSVNRSAGGMTHNAIGSAGGTQQFGGIGEVAVYSKALSLSEIQNIYNATKARYGK